MASIAEAMSSTAPQQLSAGLQLGTNTISAQATLTFQLYKKVILPVDGYVFWVNANGLTNSNAVYDAAPFNSVVMNHKQKPPGSPVQTAALSITVAGSLHYFQEIHQEEESTYSRQNYLFTAESMVNDFAALAPNEMYITTVPNGSIVAFNGQIGRYDRAGLWHYHGRALYSTEYTQIVNDPNTLSSSQIVSNSMPYWMQLSTAQLPVYPSFLSPMNLTPPFVSVHIERTDAWSQTPAYDQYLNQTQLVADEVKFTMFGLNNEAVMDFQYRVLQTSLNGGYGISSMPVIYDKKRPQSEFQILAQAKGWDLKVNYTQGSSRQIAQKLITSAFATFTPA
jgi:hypothetical protein